MNLFCCLIVTSLFFLKKLFHDHNSSTLVNQLFLLFHEVNSFLIFSHLYLTYFSPFCHLVTSDAAVRSESYSVPGTKSFMTSKQLLIQEVSFLNDLTWVPCSIVQEGGLWLSTESALALLGKKPKTPTPNLRQAVYSFFNFFLTSCTFGELRNSRGCQESFNSLIFHFKISCIFDGKKFWSRKSFVVWVLP